MLVTVGLIAAPASVFADDDSAEPAKTATTPSHADPATQTLPVTASATAKANAFGQQGARERAAHQAAKAAAHAAAKQAAASHEPMPGAAASHANAHAAGRGTVGLDHAALAGGNAGSHRH
jgi:hypothetical protein